MRKMVRPIPNTESIVTDQDDSEDLDLGAPAQTCPDDSGYDDSGDPDLDAPPLDDDDEDFLDAPSMSESEHQKLREMQARDQAITVFFFTSTF